MVKRNDDAPRKPWAQKKPPTPVDAQTRFDRFLTWFKNNKFFSILMLAAVVITAVSQLFGSIAGLVESGRSIIRSTPERTITGPMTIEPAPDPHASDKVAKLLLRMGSKGIGAGYFSSTRLLQVDPDGEIVVDESGDRSRVQRFDTKGKFIGQWFPAELDVDKKEDVVTSMALTGPSVYLGTGDQLYLHDVTTGRRLAAMTPQMDNRTDLEALAVNPLGGIVSLWKLFDGGHVLVFHDASGRVSKSAVKRLDLPDDTEHEFDPSLAVDGNGSIYLLNRARSVVYKLTSMGVFSNHFGSPGDAPGQIGAALSLIAVNGKGQICIADFNGLQLFDSDGRFVERVLMPREKDEDEYGVLAIQFDGAGNLWALYSDRVVEVALP